MRKRSVVALALGLAFALSPISIKVVVQVPEHLAWATAPAAPSKVMR